MVAESIWEWWSWVSVCLVLVGGGDQREKESGVKSGDRPALPAGGSCVF